MIRKEVLKEIIESQRDWIQRLDSGIQREILENIRLSPTKAVVISGIRRCGKSTLLKQIMEQQKEFYYLNLEDPRLEGFESKDFTKVQEIFEETYGQSGVYFFDEIQNIPNWETFIRYLIDRKKKIALTGSNASLLSRELGSKLTGRHKRVELYPLSYREFLDMTGKNPSEDTYKEYLHTGGFPEYIKEKDETDLNELLKDVIMRDIATRHSIRNTTILEKIALYLLSHTGNEYSYNSLKHMFHMKAVQSVIDYISYFEDSYLIFTIPRFSYSYKKQQVNPKKAFSIDNGLSKVNTIAFSKDTGKMLENDVFTELRRHNETIFYFQENGECDFLIKEKEKITQAIQVCTRLNEENQDREINGLFEALEMFKLKTGLLLTLDEEDQFERDGKIVLVRPVWKWLAQS